MRLLVVMLLSASFASTSPAGPVSRPPSPSATPHGVLARSRLGRAPAEGSPTALEDALKLEEARRLWSDGRYTELRKLLEPIARQPLDDPATREWVLTRLADAVINDPELPPDQRIERASELLGRLMQDPDWRMPTDLLSPELTTLYVELRNAQAERIGERCRANLVACRSDYDNVEAERARTQRALEELQRAYMEQEVEVRETVARSRILAALPFGFGHFYNGNRALGATFLTGEVVFGGAGLGLIIYRVTADGCRRTRGFQSDSLKCSPRRPTTLEATKARRRVEEGMGWVFYASIALDILLAQVFFRAEETVAIHRVKRRDLDASGTEVQKRRRVKRRDRATVRPAPGFVPGGPGMSLNITF